MPRLAACLAVLFLLCAAAPSRAQYIPPPHADETHATLNWLIGRWRMPVTCELEDGRRVNLEEAIVVRPAAEDANGRTVRATFFGIDVRGARRCFNLTRSEIPDRRGVLYLTFVSQGRPDLGLTRLRQNLETGELAYHITRGRLQIRPVGAPPDATIPLDFQGKDAALRVRVLRSSSDGFRMLESLARDDPAANRLRRVRFSIEGLEPSPFQGDYLETARRRN